MSKEMQSKAARILKLLEAGRSIAEVAKALNAKPAYVYNVRWKDLNKRKHKKPSNILKTVQEMKTALNGLGIDRKPDLVNHPPHYRAGGIETIDFIEAKDLNYRLGNVIKYVSRAGRKASDPIEDLEKAAWYLQREIEARKRA